MKTMWMYFSTTAVRCLPDKPFKAHLRDCWQYYMLEETEKLEGSENTISPWKAI